MSEVTITMTEWEAGAARLALANELGLIRKQVELHEEEQDDAVDPSDGRAIFV